MLAMKKIIEKRSEESQMQGAWSAAIETYQLGRRKREHHATLQMIFRSSFSC